jgi:RsiW-degrading membrane proteinase PrsW (M82 family)
MAAPSRGAHWYEMVPRWLAVAVIMMLLSGTAWVVAQLTGNWSILPAAIVTTAMTAPLAFTAWVDDRTHIGRSVPPDVLFITFVVGGAAATIIAGIFESDFFFHPHGHGYLWIGLVEETAKVFVPFTLCTAVPRYRPVAPALALGVVSAAGFAVFESIAYAFNGLDRSITEARHVLYERSLVTPFGHLPWTAIVVIVATREWSRKGRVVLTPKALWGFAVAVALHAIWDIVLVDQGWWILLVPVVAASSFALLYVLLKGVRYEGPYAVPAERSLPRRQP